MNQRRGSFTSLRILHFSLVVGLGLFAIIALVITRRDRLIELEESTSRLLQVISVIFSVSFLFVGFNVFKTRIMAARNSTGPGEHRFQKYWSACILWWVMIEAPGIFAIICYLLAPNFSFLFLGLFHVLILLVFLPRKENIALLLNLSSDEIDTMKPIR